MSAKKVQQKSTATPTKEPTSKPSAKNKRTKRPPRTKKQKIILGIIITILALLVIALGVIAYFIFRDTEQAKTERVEFPDPIYSVLTGEEISDAALNKNPTYCIQIPNGADGARPQAGLNQAGVIFEAIAERGITRFAAIFQNPTVSAIGPIRSLRPYYLDWDTPFDCTVVHAGGSAEAIAAINAGGQRNLDESLEYMWREQGGTRAWNNLFTSSTELAAFNKDNGYGTSDVRAFARLTPDETDKIVRERQTCPESEDGEECIVEYISPSISFGAMPSYNTVYTYNPETNTYARSYATGDPHLVYDCAPQSSTPNTQSECGELIQLTPSVVIAMIVSESQMSDGYHEDIKTTGSGNTMIFQNGGVIEGTWHKNSQTSQIIFEDNEGNEIKLAPGQTWIAAVPQYGNITY